MKKINKREKKIRGSINSRSKIINLVLHMLSLKQGYFSTQVDISKKQLGIQDSGRRSRVDVPIWDFGDI